jgi:hypothetical protein
MNDALLNKKSEEDSLCPTLTFKERIIGFLICCVVGSTCSPGYTLSILSTISMILGKGTMARFGIVYTLSNIISICA